MHLLNGGESAFLKAAFAQGVLRSISVPDSFPCSAVLFISVLCTLISVVAVPLLFFMHRTVLRSVLRKAGTAAYSAWTFRFPWHFFTSFTAYEKPREVSRARPCMHSFILPLYLFSVCQTTAKCANFRPAWEIFSRPRRERGVPSCRTRSEGKRSASMCGYRDNGRSEPGAPHDLQSSQGSL